MRFPACGLIFTMCASVANAGTIYDNGAPPLGGFQTIWFAETGAPSYAQEVADDFILQDGFSTIRDIHWWGDYSKSIGESDADIFTLTIYNDAAVAQIPGTVNTVASAISITRTPITIGTWDLFFFSAQIDPIALTAGTRYWLGITNAGGFGWGWATTETPGNLRQTLVKGTDVWDLKNENATFYLTDDVPAPGALAIVVPAGVTIARRRR